MAIFINMEGSSIPFKKHIIFLEIHMMMEPSACQVKNLLTRDCTTAELSFL